MEQLTSNKKLKRLYLLNILQRCELHLSDYVELLNGLREDEFTGIDDLDTLTEEISLILHSKKGEHE